MPVYQRLLVRAGFGVQEECRQRIWRRGRSRLRGDIFPFGSVKILRSRSPRCGIRAIARKLGRLADYLTRLDFASRRRSNNLAHRHGNGDPQLLEPGKPVEIELTLDACGYRFAPGHRIRVSFSSAYWPTILPSPYDATLSIDLATLQAELPLLGAHRRIEIPEPANPNPLPHYDVLAQGSSGRSVKRDLQQGVTRHRVQEDSGLSRHPVNGLCSRDTREEIWSMTLGDPLSMTGETSWTCSAEREGWRVLTHYASHLSCTETEWVISERIEALHGEDTVFERERSARIPRDHM